MYVRTSICTCFDKNEASHTGNASQWTDRQPKAAYDDNLSLTFGVNMGFSDASDS